MRFRTILACLVVALAVAGTTAGAASLLTGSNIKNGTLSSQDIKKNGIVKNRLSLGVQHLLDNVGKTGATGATGATGPAGPVGGKGDKGDTGLDAVTRVTSLPGSGWAGSQGHDPDVAAGALPSDVDPPAPSVVSGGVKLGPYTVGPQYSRVTFTGLPAGTTVKDLSDIQYTASYTQTGTDHKFAMPYLRITTNLGRIVFAVGPDQDVMSGRTQTWDVINGSVEHPSLVSYGDLAGTFSWDHEVALHGDEVVQSILIGNGDQNVSSANTSALIQSVTLRAAGFPLHQYDFGT